MATKSKKRAIRYSNAKTVAEGMDSGFKPTTFKVPEGMTLHRFQKPGKHKIDIMPYVVGKGNPAEGVTEGDVHFERTFFVHKGGSLPQHFTCNRLTFGKSCKACKHVAKMASDPDADQDLIDELKPKKRQLWVFRDRGDKEAGFQLAETPHYKSFGGLVKDEIDNSDDDGPATRFYHLKNGATCVVKVKKDSYNGRPYMQVTSVEFEDREKDYKESVLDDMPCLDDLIIEADQDELAEALTGGEDDDDDDDKSKGKKGKKGKKSKSKKKDEDDEDEEDEDDEDSDSDDDDSDDEESEDEEEDESDEDEDGEEDDEDADESEIEKGSTVTHKKHGSCTVVKLSKDGDVLSIKDEDGEVHRGIKLKDVKLAEDEEDDDEDDEEDEDDGKKGKKKKKKPSKDEDDEDDEDDSDDDEDDEEEGDEDEGEIVKGSTVKWKYNKKMWTGVVKSIKKGLAHIKSPKKPDSIMSVRVSDLELTDEEEDEDEDEDDEEEEEEKPKKGKKKKSKKDDEDEDIPFEEDEEDEDEDEKPKKKKKSKK